MTIIAWKKIAGAVKKPPTRLNIAVMMFCACLVSYMVRVNLSLNLIAMVNSEKSNTSATLPDYGPRYNWSKEDEGYLLGSYFWGYMVTSLPAGVAAAHFGGTAVVGYTLAISTILTALLPLAAGINMWLMIAVRILTGALGGFLYPALHTLISKWSPPDEKGKFVSSLMGGTFGTVVTWPLCGVITSSFGYAWAFYVCAAICGLVTILWFIVVADTPEKHKGIAKDEREYIVNSLSDSLSKSSTCPPVVSLLLSIPFWALLILHYGNMWGLYFLITAAPKFMSEVLGFKLADAGFLSSLPHLARMIFAFGFGGIGDLLKKREIVSVTFIRKFFTTFSHILPGIFLIIMAYYGRAPYVCVAIMTISLGLNGSAAITNLQNSQDLAPNYAGTLYGIINFVGTTPGFFSPMIVAYFTKDENTMDQWIYIFLIGASAYIVPAILFIIFGSGNKQPWNDNPKKDDDAA